MSRLLIVCAALFTAPALAENPKALVTGTITLDGKPLDECMISFHPADNTKVPYKAKSDKDGKYKSESLPPGEYTVTCLKIVTDEATKKVVTVTPSKYADPQTSGIKVTVKDGANQADINLKGK